MPISTVKKYRLYRILGSDLPPRHAIGQTYSNAKFILECEPDFTGCEKKWIVNRIVDRTMEQKIIGLLENKNQPYIRIPFDYEEEKAARKRKATEYAAFGKKFSFLSTTSKISIKSRIKALIKRLRWRSYCDIERHNRILYTMNNNGARNVALRDGRQRAEWVLPFDGNCCFTAQGWKDVVEKLSAQKSYARCFAVPMYRLADNSQYFNFIPEGAVEEEPQVLFGRDCPVEFNESYRYGYRSKIEVLSRCGFSLAFMKNAAIVTDPAKRYGYVTRLSSGVKEDEYDWRRRSLLREESIDIILKKIDENQLGL